MQDEFFYDSDDDSISEFNGFTTDDILGETLGLNDNSSDHDLSSDSDDVPLSHFIYGRNIEPNENVKPEPNRPATWTLLLSEIQLDAFTEPVGAVNVLEKDAKEIDFFHQIFTENWYEKVAQETNRYGQSKITQNGADPKWLPTTSDEIRMFIGFNILMGIVIAPNQDMYFSTDSMFRPTGMSESITRDQFDKLCQYFHVSDISSNPDRGQPGHDKLAHVRPFLEDIRVQCKTQYSPHCETSIDEAMVAYTGRLSIKQHLPLKPTKRGIKIWARADPHNGFLNDFQVYTGKTNNVVEIGLGERVVKDLTRNIWGKNHHVYCNNYFTSVPLFQDLLENKTYACGTICTNRKYLPPAITQAKLKNEGEMVIEQKEGSIVAVAWHDKRTVTILSTLSNPLEMSSVKRRKKDGSQVDVPCPTAIQSYTAHMNGVDRVDQLRSSYSLLTSCQMVEISILVRDRYFHHKWLHHDERVCKPPG